MWYIYSNGILLLLFSCPVGSDFLWPHGLQHTRFPCPSSSPGFFPSSCSLHRWCCPAISFSDTLFSFFPQSFLASITDFSNELSVHIRWPKYWSFSFSISPSSEYSWLISFRMDWLDSQESSPAPQFEDINSLAFCLLFGPALTTVCDHWEDHSLDYTDICQQGDVSAFQPRLAFLPRSNHLLISWLQSPSTVILEPKKIKSVTTSTFSPSICHEVMGLEVMDLRFFNI